MIGYDKRYLRYSEVNSILRQAKTLDQALAINYLPYLVIENIEDFEQVVRCKDCDRSKKTAVGYICTMLGASVASDGNGFCSNGRKV